MSWVTFIWAMLIGLCVATALPEIVTWIWRRRVVDLFFVILTAAAIENLSGELAVMHASSVEQVVGVLHWRYLGLFAEAARP